jgi:hypothetical protein
MRTKKIEVAKLVAARLFEAERAIDLAATRIAELNAAMPMARLDANMSAMIGQDAFESSTDALTFVARARERMVNAHVRLKAVLGDLGIAEISFGDSIKPPSASAVQGSGGHLRVAS